MPSSFNKAKSNHMIEYYRKQSDKKMVQSIIHMKSELSQNFSMQKFSRKKSIQNPKRQMLQTLKKQKIHQENKKIVYRIKQVRQKTMRDNLKYLDNTNCERLTQTRNQFRNRARQQQKNKVTSQNKRILKRLLNAQSRYSFNESMTDLSQQKSTRKSQNRKSSKCIDMNYAKYEKCPNYFETIEKQLQATPSGKTIRNDLNIKKRAKTQFGHTVKQIVQAYELQKDVQRKNSFSKYTLTLPQTNVARQVEKNLKANDVKIPIKNREIKLEYMKKCDQSGKKTNPEYSKGLKKTIQAKGFWNNSWNKSYRIVI